MIVIGYCAAIVIGAVPSQWPLMMGVYGVDMGDPLDRTKGNKNAVLFGLCRLLDLSVRIGRVVSAVGMGGEAVAVVSNGVIAVIALLMCVC